MNRLSTAYAGSGNVDPVNAAAILDNFLPEDPPEGQGLGLVIIPDRVPRVQKGLKTVVAWLEGEVGAEGTIPESNIIEALLARREYDKDGETCHDDLCLVMLYDPASGLDNAIVKEATENGIRVVDLCAAGDDLDLDKFLLNDPEAGEAAAQEEAASETPADEKPPWEPDAPIDVKAQVASATAAGIAAAAAHGLGSFDISRLGSSTFTGAPLNPGVAITVIIPPEAIQAVADALRAAMAAPAFVSPENGSQASLDGAEPAATIETSGEQAPGTTPYYYNEDKCQYRPARGRLRDGEAKVFLTEAGIAEIKRRNLLA